MMNSIEQFNILNFIKLVYISINFVYNICIYFTYTFCIII